MGSKSKAWESEFNIHFDKANQDKKVESQAVRSILSAAQQENEFEKAIRRVSDQINLCDLPRSNLESLNLSDEENLWAFFFNCQDKKTLIKEILTRLAKNVENET